MLQSYHIARASLACVIAGTAMLIAFNAITEPKNMKIREISEETLDCFVRVQGFVSSYYKKDGVLLFELNDGKKMKVVVFNPSDSEEKLVKKGSFLTVEGRVQKYKGSLEIIAGSVRNA